jgi:nuclear pore complex protein Nup98-Nup96
MGGGMYGQPQMQQPQYGGGGFGGGFGGGMYGQPQQRQQQPQYGGGMYGGGFNQQQPQQQQPYNPYAQPIMGGMPKFNMQAMY